MVMVKGITKKTVFMKLCSIPMKHMQKKKKKGLVRKIDVLNDLQK